MNNNTKRWFILLAGIIANLCQGAAYASSVFAGPMLKHLNLFITGSNGLPAPDMKKWVMAFSINLAMLPIGMLLTGKLSDKVSPRLVVLLGGIVFGGGIFLAGYTNSLTWLYLTFGVMGGLGSGAAYGAVVATSVRWFPERRGLASGLAVGALGFGTVLIAPIAMKLMASGPSPEIAVLYTLKVLGIAFLAIISLASIVMVNPPKDFVVATSAKSTTIKAAVSANDLTWTQMLGKGKFWLLYLLYACGAFAGLMIISQASQIAMGIKTPVLDADLLKQYATLVVSSIAIANAFGRVAWGWISDRIGRLQALSLMFLITMITMFLFPSLAASKNTLILAALPIGLCYGGYLGLFPSLCADAFGGRNMAVNYALLFSAFSVAAIVGPRVGALIKQRTLSYDQAFVVAGVVALVGLLISLGMVIAQAKADKAEAASA